MGLIKGLDVSDNQRDINWAQVKASGVERVYIKLSEGVDYEDPMAEKHVAGAKAAGLPYGFYHYGRPDHHPTPEAEVAWFLQLANRIGMGELPPVLDIEVEVLDENGEPKDLSAYAEGFLTGVGHGAMLYSGPYYIGRHLKEVSNEHPLWIADYGVNEPNLCQWKEYTQWQYTETGIIGGVTGDVDLSWCVAPEPDVVAEEPAQHVTIPFGYISLHAHGPAVFDLQECLNAAGAKPKLTLDGQFGPATETALIAFQKKYKLQPDGVYGPMTAAKFKEVLLK